MPAVVRMLLLIEGSSRGAQRSNTLPDGQVIYFSIRWWHKRVHITHISLEFHVIVYGPWIDVVMLSVSGDKNWKRKVYYWWGLVPTIDFFRLRDSWNSWATVRCISTVSTENHRQLLENTVLCGGTASMAGEMWWLLSQVIIFFSNIKIYSISISFRR